MRRRRPTVPPPGAAPSDDDQTAQTAWLITFSDLVLQLFAFVVLSAVIARPGRAADPMPAPPSTTTLVVRTTTTTTTTSSTSTSSTTLAAASVVGEDRTSLVRDHDELATFVQQRGIEGAVTVSIHDRDLVIAMSDTIAFASGSADLADAALPLLTTVRDLATSLPDCLVDVTGHTDDRPIHTPAFPSNLELSLARAAAVARELAAGDPELERRIVAAGVGAHRPVVPNTDDEARARNRRVEIRLRPRAADEG
ncbi:MAG TPA: OmpA family protein [Candidatus Eisenbacteria bacterium]|nr:OmpA family protein [Candidatus Eisenbacteria bacterium]